MNYIKRMRDLREDNDKTQQEIADVLGTSQTMYARYERGANELPIRHLLKLCRYYSVSSDYFLGLTDKRNWIQIKSTLSGAFDFFIQAAGLAYHRRTTCGAYHQPFGAVSHHALACISAGQILYKRTVEDACPYKENKDLSENYFIWKNPSNTWNCIAVVL